MPGPKRGSEVTHQKLLTKMIEFIESHGHTALSELAANSAALFRLQINKLIKEI